MFNERYGLETAALEYRKTRTARISKKLNAPDVVSISEWGIDGKGRAMVTVTKADGSLEDVYPAYQPGEVVAVAQRYKDVRDIIGDGPHDGKFLKFMEGWNNKMFVRADLMPHQIRITNVKYERLQDISDEDCLREGIRKMTFDTFSFDSWKFFTHNPREAFAALIDKVSGKGTWEMNPYVFVYEFERIG